MTDVLQVPIVEVHASNIVELWPSLVLAVRSSTFIAIDTVSSLPVVTCGQSNLSEAASDVALSGE